MNILLSVVISLFLSSTATAGIYKCQDNNGRAIFSQQPCGSDAVEVEVTEPKSISNEPLNDQRQDNSDLVKKADLVTKRRLLTNKIRDTKEKISILQNKQRDKVAAYRQEMMRSAYNSAGVSRSQKYQALIDGVNEKYNAEISQKKNKLSELQSQINELGD